MSASFPKVLLTSNPQIERDLQQRLSRISACQERRKRALESNQRIFLVAQIFDDDRNLRFTNSHSSHQRHADGGVTSSRSRDVADSGLGIFLPPLPPEQRLIERQRLRSTTLDNKATVRASRHSDSETKAPAERQQRDVNDSRLLPKSASRIMYFTDDSLIKRQQTAVAGRYRSMSMPNVSQSAYLDTEVATLDDKPRTVHFKPVGARATYAENRKSLCDEHVIGHLTRTLPMSLMIKANQNINKEVNRRKSIMIARCQQARDVSMTDDPRWLKLQESLRQSSQLDNRI